MKWISIVLNEGKVYISAWLSDCADINEYKKIAVRNFRFSVKSIHNGTFVYHLCLLWENYIGIKSYI